MTTKFHQKTWYGNYFNDVALHSSKYNRVICPGQVYEDAGIIYL